MSSGASRKRTIREEKLINLFQGRNIDVLIAPEILSQKKSGTTTPDLLKP